jgi:hypothetical protein
MDKHTKFSTQIMNSRDFQGFSDFPIFRLFAGRNANTAAV